MVRISYCPSCGNELSQGSLICPSCNLDVGELFAKRHLLASNDGDVGNLVINSFDNRNIEDDIFDNPNANATCEVTVDTIHVTSVTLNKTSTTLAVGETETLTKTVLPETATDKSVT